MRAAACEALISDGGVRISSDVQDGMLRECSVASTGSRTGPHRINFNLRQPDTAVSHCFGCTPDSWQTDGPVKMVGLVLSNPSSRSKVRARTGTRLRQAKSASWRPGLTQPLHSGIRCAASTDFDAFGLLLAFRSRHYSFMRDFWMAPTTSCVD